MLEIALLVALSALSGQQAQRPRMEVAPYGMTVIRQPFLLVEGVLPPHGAGAPPDRPASAAPIAAA